MTNSKAHWDLAVQAAAEGYIPHAEAYAYNGQESYVSNVGSTEEKAIHGHMITIL